MHFFMENDCEKFRVKSYEKHNFNFYDQKEQWNGVMNLN